MSGAVSPVVWPSPLTTPVLVIGTGISGLFTALQLADAGVAVTLLTKTSLSESNSRYAQGGIAAVLPQNLDDSLDLHVTDTLRAGAGLCNEPAVWSILSEGSHAIEALLAYGVPFDREADQTLAMTQEGAHSVRRVVHAGGDATGHSVEMALIQRVHCHPTITVMEHVRVCRLLTDKGRCVGALAIQYDQQPLSVLAAYVVLATGGAGQLYAYSTNPAIATGDGLFLAANAGACLQDLEFVQFHPTAFYAGGQTRFLISEALRGEGGVLRNKKGEAFAGHYHPQADLAPRDVMTRAIYTEMQREHSEHVWLDVCHLPPHMIQTRFPTILTLCQPYGIDIRRDPIPVAPAAHYLMGGVAVNPHGQSSVEHLLAVGEVAHTGLHGANRLASNSLLECVVLARRVAAFISGETLDIPPVDWTALVKANRPQEGRQTLPSSISEQAEAAELLLHMKHRMWQSVGIVRTEDGLHTALADLKQLQQRALAFSEPDHPVWQQLTTALWMTEAALARTQSIGAHYRLPHLPTAQQVA